MGPERVEDLLIERRLIGHAGRSPSSSAQKEQTADGEVFLTGTGRDAETQRGLRPPCSQR